MKVSLCLFAAAMLGGCVAAGYDNGYDNGDVGVGVSYVGGFYDPCCYGYGGWGPGYRVGPPHGHDGHGFDHGGHAPGRPAPSIPHAARGGGGDAHGGGGHAGGGHGGGGHH